jgi:Uma2 family endonuclease
MSALPKLWTVTDYLTLAANSDIRHELIDGEIYDMSGSSLAHDLITGNIFAMIHAQSRGSVCTPFTGSMRVKVNSSNFFYPDLSVACGDPQFNDDNPPSLLNPVFVVEVQSESTTDKDWQVKLPLYQHMPSVQEIVLIEQDRVELHHFQRDPHDGSPWVKRVYADPATEMQVPSIGCILTLGDLYQRVVFS